MAARWSWSGPEGRARWAVRALCLGVLLGAAVPAGAATVLSRDVRLQVAADGAVTERLALKVRLDEAGDLASWSPYPIVLDTNRTLVNASGQAIRPDGTRVILGADDLETVAGAGGAGILHSSAELRLLRFPPLPAGTELAIAYEVHEEPWFASGAISLVGEEPVDRLEVRIETPPGSAARAGLRWRIDGPADTARDAGDDSASGRESGDQSGIESQGESGEEGSAADGIHVEETEAGLVLRGTNLPGGDGKTVLRYAWGPVRTWQDVARWYADLTRDVPRGGDGLEAVAREATAGLDSPRARTEALLDRVRHDIRYVAVEVGVGGYRPSAPAEVLGRRWGDCKDKAFLLIDLLGAAGIEAYPVLVLLDRERRIDDRFPGPEQFNHLIVAVPEDAVGARPGDVTADGYLFLDPTQERGGLTWIHPALQGQRALVAGGAHPGLVTLPVLSEREVKELTVRLTVGDAGGAAGEAVLRLSGHGAWRLAEGTESATPERLSEVSRRLLGALLTGADVGDPRWREGEVNGLPLVELTAPVRFDRLVEGRTVESIALPGPVAFPDPADLDSVDEPLSVEPVRWNVTWQIALPPGRCPLDGREVVVENPVGSFHQAVTSEGDLAAGWSVRVTRQAEVAVRWIEPGDAAAARELSLAERRTLRRRLRLRCLAGEEP